MQEASELGAQEACRWGRPASRAHDDHRVSPHVRAAHVDAMRTCTSEQEALRAEGGVLAREAEGA